MISFDQAVLGRTRLVVGRLGLSSSYGVPTAAVEEAFERGVNYFYWGSMRRDAFGQAIRHLSSQRDRMVLVLQSYSPLGGLLRGSVQRGLRALRLDYTDVLLLGYWSRPVPERVLESARQLQQQGLVRHLALSTHRRSLAAQLAADPTYGAFHIRYNAVHPGAEIDIFPRLPAESPPGMVAFTATSHRELLQARHLPPGERVPTATDCYRFVLSDPHVDVCMTGPSTLEHVRASLRALDLGSLSTEEMAWMRRVGQAKR